MSPRILVVEDDPDIAAIVVDYLRHAGYTVEHQAEGRAALASLLTTPPDLTLLDIMLPGMNGLAILRQARRHTQHPIIMLTARVEEVDRLIGLELGADDYSCKPFSPREVAARVRAIVRREARFRTSNEPPTALWRHDPDAMRIEFHGQALAMTRYEYLLLALLLSAPGRVFTREQIMSRVWAHAPDTDDRSIDTHVKTLRAKLRAIAPQSDPIQTHRGTGYSLLP